jgi:hypothetical protein
VHLKKGSEGLEAEAAVYRLVVQHNSVPP